MKVALLLHAHQPPTQYPQITKDITERSYRPLVDILKRSNGAITLNITASLTEQLVEQGEDVLLQEIAALAQNGKLELTGTAAYHPLLTKIPESEIKRQVQRNKDINVHAFGQEAFRPDGFFLPEMVFNEEVGKILDDMDIEWIILDESAYPGAGVKEEAGKHSQFSIGKNLYVIENTDLNVFFRDRPLSLGLAFNQFQTEQAFVEAIREHHGEYHEQVLVIALDAETFGHHHEDNLDLLDSLLNSDVIEFVTITSLLSSSVDVVEISPLRSTWGIALEPVPHHRVFPRWNNPDNPVHQLQWMLFNLAISKPNHLTSESDSLDKGLNSDQFWWASRLPCWHPGMVQRGAELLKQSILDNERMGNAEKETAHHLASEIKLRGEESYGKDVIDC